MWGVHRGTRGFKLEGLFFIIQEASKCVFIPLSVSLSRFWVRLCVTNRILSLNQNKKKHTSLHHAWISHRANGAAAPIITGGWYACSLHIVLRVLAGDRLCWKLQPRQERGQKGPLRTVWTDFTVNAKSVRPLFFFKVYCVILISFRFMIASETCWYALFAIRNLKPKWSVNMCCSCHII